MNRPLLDTARVGKVFMCLLAGVEPSLPPPKIRHHLIKAPCFLHSVAALGRVVADRHRSSGQDWEDKRESLSLCKSVELIQ